MIGDVANRDPEAIVLQLDDVIEVATNRCHWLHARAELDVIAYRKTAWKDALLNAAGHFEFLLKTFLFDELLLGSLQIPVSP